MKGYKLDIIFNNTNVFGDKFDIEPMTRRIILPENTTMAELHLTIQKLFGLSNQKDYEFSYDGYLSPRELSNGYIPHNRFCSTHKDLSRIFVDKFFQRNISFDYEYDYSSEWCFFVRFKKIVEYDKYYSTILSFKGEYNIVEDCGGPWGLEHFLKIIKTPPENISKHDARILKKFKKFDMEQTQEELKSILEVNI